MVQSLLVFVCDSSYQALEYAAWSSQFTFLTRCFILTSERLDVKKLNWRKDSDIFLNLNNIINSKDKMDICIRGALMYSSPKYQNILMLKDSNFCDEESLTKTINYLNENFNFVKNKDLIGFTREYVVLNDTTFIETINQNQKQDEDDEISLGLEISNALMGLEVDTAPFCEAIKEITSIEMMRMMVLRKFYGDLYKLYNKIIKYYLLVKEKKVSDTQLITKNFFTDLHIRTFTEIDVLTIYRYRDTYMYCTHTYANPPAGNQRSPERFIRINRTRNPEP
jgi:hypothetical protein